MLLPHTGLIMIFAGMGIFVMKPLRGEEAEMMIMCWIVLIVI